MAREWRPGRDIAKFALLYARRVAGQVRAASPRVAHASRKAAPTGGSLPAKIRSRSLVVERRWGAVLSWASLGQPFLWFRRGTKRQKARPVDLTPSEDEVATLVRRSAVRHLEGRDARESRGRR